MTTINDPSEPRRSADQGGSGRKRLLPILAIGAAVLAGLLWFFLIRDTSAADVNTDEAAEARQEAIDEVASPEASSPAVNDGVEGTWTIDTSIGTFGDACLTDVCDTTFVGFRIDEELASVGAKTVVGRSPGVSGTMAISGTSIESVDVLVDMTQLITDTSGRTGALRGQSIETSAFPEASFVLTEPIDLGTLPADGEAITVLATGDFTIHGVTRTETIDLTAELNGNVIVAFGQLGPVLLADYDIDLPSAAVVLSVEDNAMIELQLFFTKSS